MLNIFCGQTFVLIHFVLMLSTLDFLNALSTPPYNTYFRCPLLPPVSHTLSPHGLSSTLSAYHHVYSTIFLFPLGEVIDMIRVISKTSTPR